MKQRRQLAVGVVPGAAGISGPVALALLFDGAARPANMAMSAFGGRRHAGAERGVGI
jgi:hypothetical protein